MPSMYSKRCRGKPTSSVTRLLGYSVTRLLGYSVTREPGVVFEATVLRGVPYFVLTLRRARTAPRLV